MDTSQFVKTFRGQEHLEPVAPNYLVTLPARQFQKIVVAVSNPRFAVEH